MDSPKTLQVAILYFADFDRCREFLTDLRWPDGKVACPQCGSDHVVYLEKARQWKCYGKHSSPKFSLKTGTIFEDSPLGLDKWLAALWLLVNCKNGISSCEIARSIGITQKSAWFMAHRLRFALHYGSFDKLSGDVEVDETFIGGKARNMHVAQRQRRITGTGGKDKTAVMGILERGGKVRTTVVPNRKKTALQAEVTKHVEATPTTAREKQRPLAFGLRGLFLCTARARRERAPWHSDHRPNGFAKPLERRWPFVNFCRVRFHSFSPPSANACMNCRTWSSTLNALPSS